MSYTVTVHDLALNDIKSFPRNVHARLLRAIEQRLTTAPGRYGVRLRQSLAGLWKMRVGDYRIVYEIEERTVTIWAIRHRKDVYRAVRKRVES